jgi:hypothetical protein
MNIIIKTFLLSIACTCFASAGSLDGTWINIDQNTRSIPKIVIASTSKDGTQLKWWGKAHPQDTQNGPFKLTLLGDSARDPSPDKHAYAKEDEGFADRIFFITTSGDQLVMECLTLFKANDKLGRSNFRERLTFKKL